MITFVPPEFDSGSLLSFLAGQFPYLSSERWAERCARGDITVSDRPADAERQVHVGEKIVVAAPDAIEDEPAVPLVHADPDVVVVDKPAHLVCHPESAFPKRTFARRLAQELGLDRLDFVHRLDRGTTGLVVLSTSAAATAGLHEQLRAGTFEKDYVAIVHGVIRKEKFSVDLAIGRHPTSTVPVRRATEAEGALDAKPARTDFRVVIPGAETTLVRACPGTGRTHQVRVHLASAGHPIVGDALYGKSDAEYEAYREQLRAREESEPTAVARHLLHAERIAFDHPTDGRRTELRAPWPGDIASAAFPSSG